MFPSKFFEENIAPLFAFCKLYELYTDHFNTRTGLSGKDWGRGELVDNLILVPHTSSDWKIMETSIF